ncbi:MULTISPECIES: metallophosphoesterase [unclassified Rhizobium]|uniref:metallophosphoesterase n=1 Tax=unclassified Rhizobium TaxID=2613769 RepID=UPI00247AAAFC|nr:MULTISPECIES: metallophosphoesterase [unclassified Rhizobium]MDH7802409.1 putative MPP superfamily phosphohydrolase [Rhizobium sp. AN70]
MEKLAHASQLELFDGKIVTASDRLTILHVSDFHFNVRKKREQEIVVKALLDDVSKLCIGHRNPDIIIFSGDLTQGPPSDTHAEAYDLLLEPLQKVTNISSERMFVVAGNHDVERDAVAKFLPEHTKWRSESNDMTAMNSAFESGEFEAAYHAKFANYLDLEDYMAKSSIVFSNIFCSVYHIDALNLDILIFNSSVLSTGGLNKDDRDEGLLTIPEYAIRDAVSHLKPGAFRIFTTHHPLNAFTETGSSYLAKEIQRSADLHLFGHMHDPSGAQIVGFEGTVITNQAGAVYTHRTDWYIGYALLCVDRSKGYHETILKSYFPERSKFDDAIDRVADGRFYNSQEARQYWRGLSNPVDAETFRTQLAGQVLEALIKEWSELSLLDQGGRQHFVAPRLHKIDTAAPKESRTRVDTPLPFKSLAADTGNVILYSPQEYGRTTILRELQYELLATSHTIEQPRLPIMIDFDQINQNPANMARIVRSRSLMAPQAFDTDSLLKLGLVCLLIDDVVFDDHKRMGILRAFISAYPQCRYVFTSLKTSAAPYGTHVVPETPVRFEFVELCELKRREMRELIRLKVPDDAAVEVILKRLHSEISEINLPFTAANGTILMTIYEQNSNFQPINRSVVIEQFVDATLRKGSADQSKRETFDYSNKTSLLAHLAGWMARQNCYEPSQENLREEMKSYITNIGLVANLDEILTEFFAAKIMRKLPDSRVSFRYRAVLEYFIATEMIKNQDFKDWVLDDVRYLTYINELHYYAGLTRNDTRIADLLYERFNAILEDNQLAAPFDPADIATVKLPRKGSAESLAQLSSHVLGQPLTKEEKDAALDGEIPRDVEERQSVFRPRIEHPGHRLLVGLFLFSGIIKNMEQIPASNKRKHLKLAWKGWAWLLSASLAIVEELAKKRQMRINGVLYEISAPLSMTNEELGRRIAITMPASITKFIAAAMGTEKLQLQLTEPTLDDAEDPLVYEFFRSCLIAELGLNVTPSAVRNALKTLAKSDYLLEALAWKLGELRRMDEIAQHHFEAVQSDLAGTIVRLTGGDEGKDKSRQIEQFKREGLLLKMQRQKDDA